MNIKTIEVYEITKNTFGKFDWSKALLSFYWWTRSVALFWTRIKWIQRYEKCVGREAESHL